MTDLAINDKGEALRFDNGRWVPAEIAQNDKGHRMAFDGKGWRALPGGKPGAFDGALKSADAAFDKVNQGVNWAGTQLTKGVTGIMGAPRAAADLLQEGTRWAGDKLGAPSTFRGLSIHGAIPGGMLPPAETMNRHIFGSLGVPEVNAGDNPALTLTNPFGLEGKVNVGKMADVGVQALPGALALGGGALPAFLGGVTSEAAGQATEGTPYELPARIFGALPGAYAGTKITTPLPARLTPEEARNVAIAKANDVPLTVGQETGRGRYVESALSRFPTSAGVMAGAADDQAVAVNRSALATMGAKGDRLDPPTMATAHREASDAFETAKNMPGGVKLTPDFYRNVEGKVADYIEAAPPSGVVPAVEKKLGDFKGLLEPAPAAPKLTASAASTVRRPTLDNIVDAIKQVDGLAPAGSPRTSLSAWFGEVVPRGHGLRVPKGAPELTNEQYQEFRRGLNTALQNTTDGSAKQALKGMRDALDDAAGASLEADKMAAWKEARKNWANLKILSKATAGGTVESRRSGDLSPSALTQALRQAQGPDRFARTEGGLNDIARMSGYLADTMPNSGTPQMLQWQRMLSGGGVAAGAGAGFAVGGVPGALGGAAAMMAPNLVARAMTGAPGTGWLRNYLANQALPNTRQSVATVPFALAPGILTDQRVRQ